jgi:hypothetical protein
MLINRIDLKYKKINLIVSYITRHRLGLLPPTAWTLQPHRHHLPVSSLMTVGVMTRESVNGSVTKIMCQFTDATFLLQHTSGQILT